MPDGSEVLPAIRRLLTESGITFREVHHEPTRTSEESAKARGDNELQERAWLDEVLPAGVKTWKNDDGRPWPWTTNATDGAAPHSGKRCWTTTYPGTGQYILSEDLTGMRGRKSATLQLKRNGKPNSLQSLRRRPLPLPAPRPSPRSHPGRHRSRRPPPLRHRMIPKYWSLHPK